MSETNQTQTEQPQTQSQLFTQLRNAIVEHSAGHYLRLKDGESQVVTVEVKYDPNNSENWPPREEEVQNFDKTKMVWKLRLDCYLGNNTKSDTKIFHVRTQDKAEILALLERGVRRLRISRYGSTAQNTKYTFTPE